ncbi:kinase-like protein [Hypomontagnella monticulosa]|nr:kinase-like protein [Hypomontagnella monticulosa]
MSVTHSEGARPESLTREAEIEYHPLGAWLDVEDVQLYNKGGLHPVHLGDLLDGRFEVVHKLGHGGFSTVWLCLDKESQKWRAVKINTADYSSQAHDNTVMEHLRRGKSPKQLENSHIAVPHEEFWIEGVNGRHLCLVTDVFSWTVADWSLLQDPVDEKTPVSIKNVCRQIVTGVRFLHSEGVCHGDLKPANILMRLQGIDGLSKSEILELTGEPELATIETVSEEQSQSHAPEYCVPRIPSEWCDDFVSKTIAITDLGEAFHIDNTPKTTGIPTLYAAPEILFEGVPGFSSDIWSLACTIYEIKENRPLFGSLWGSGTDNILTEMGHYLGPLPEPYRTVYRKQRLAYLGKPTEDESNAGLDLQTEKEDGGHIEIYESEAQGPDDMCPFEETLGRERQLHRDIPNSEHLPPEKQQETITYRYPKNDVLMLADLLRGMLKYDPAKRIDIDAVSNHPWLRIPSEQRVDRRAVVRSCNQVRALMVLGLSSVLLLIIWAILATKTISYMDTLDDGDLLED